MLWTNISARSRGLIVGVTVILVAIISGVIYNYRYTHPAISLYSAGVVLDPSGMRVAVPPGTPSSILYPGTRVERSGVSQSSVRDRSFQINWLKAGKIPGGNTKYSGLARSALLDMKLATDRKGAVVAGWASAWHYVWPRDAAFVAVAFARTGHMQEADSILNFLESVSRPQQLYEARYHIDGSPVADGRRTESDETGLVLWALQQAASCQRGKSAEVYKRHQVLLSNLTSTLLEMTNTPTALPAPSTDYWELHESRLTLEVAATSLVGLQSASTAYAALGDRVMATRLSSRAGTLRRSIQQYFGPLYPRYAGAGAGQGQQDAAIAFLMPPFQEISDYSVLAAWSSAAICMRRPAGGLAPGCTWKQDGVSWTPETTLFAMAAASNGKRADAVRWLDFTRTSVSSLGAIPEKVSRDGTPGSVAPLAWSDACTILALLNLYPEN